MSGEFRAERYPHYGTGGSADNFFKMYMYKTKKCAIMILSNNRYVYL